MKCMNDCKVSCYFHSRVGCTIDNTVNMRAPKPKYVPKYDQYGMVGRYKVKKGSR